MRSDVCGHRATIHGEAAARDVGRAAVLGPVGGERAAVHGELAAGDVHGAAELGVEASARQGAAGDGSAVHHQAAARDVDGAAVLARRVAGESRAVDDGRARGDGDGAAVYRGVARELRMREVRGRDAVLLAFAGAALDAYDDGAAVDEYRAAFVNGYARIDNSACHGEVAASLAVASNIDRAAELGVAVFDFASTDGDVAALYINRAAQIAVADAVLSRSMAVLNQSSTRQSEVATIKVNSAAERGRSILDGAAAHRS